MQAGSYAESSSAATHLLAARSNPAGQEGYHGGSSATISTLQLRTAMWSTLTRWGDSGRPSSRHTWQPSRCITRTVAGAAFLTCMYKHMHTSTLRQLGISSPSTAACCRSIGWPVSMLGCMPPATFQQVPVHCCWQCCHSFLPVCEGPACATPLLIA